MKTINRRGVVGGAIWAVVAAGVSFAVLPSALHATPLASSLAGAVKSDGLVEKARVTIHVHPRRHHRRHHHRRHYHCWWNGNRRVCGWR